MSTPISSVTEAKDAIRLLGDAIRCLQSNQLAERTSLITQIQMIKDKYLKDVYAAKKAASKKGFQDATKGTRCQFRIDTKNRYCKHYPVDGTLFCNMHTEFSERKGKKRKRVPCPLNSKHSVYEHDVESHIKICPDRPRPIDTSRAFYVASANRGLIAVSTARPNDATTSSTSTSPTSTSTPTLTATSLSINLRDPNAVRSFNTKVEKLLENVQRSQNGIEPRFNELTPASCQKHLENATTTTLTTAINMNASSSSKAASSTTNSSQNSSQNDTTTTTTTTTSSSATLPIAVPKMLKHARQIASIVGNIEQANLSSDPKNTAFVELGAGKGTLSCMLSETAGRGGSFVLVDRGTGFRNKSDKKIKDAAGSFERITMDIADLKLAALPGVANQKECILVSKHLCGLATCFALRSAVAMKCESCTDSESLHQPALKSTKLSTASNASNASAASKTSSSIPRVKGMALATCCHHLCTWKDYVNREFFIQGGFTEKDFNTLLRMTSWATSGFGKARSIAYKMNVNDLTDDEKREFGKRCKTAIDVGRLLYLENNGFQCEIVQYIDRSITPENRLLVVTNVV
tara:strand:+ start:136 stop:1866 length:1731 start_codon:yes stop_codon:yes gene_type:complete